MPKLIVLGHGDKPQVFQLKTGTVRVGRGEHCELRLPNVSVSREHVHLHVSGPSVRLEDLGSQNGVLVNGERVESRDLQRGDEVAMGRYRLVFLSDGSADRFYNGHFVGYLPPFEAELRGAAGGNSEAGQAATFALSTADLRKMAEGGHLVDSARVVSADKPDRFWRPGDRRLSFGGGNAMIPTRGWFTWGVVAEVSWKGSSHVLSGGTLFVSCAVNGERVNDARALRHGDRVRIGQTHFVYDAPPLRAGKSDTRQRRERVGISVQELLGRGGSSAPASPSQVPGGPKIPDAAPRRAGAPPRLPPKKSS